MRYTKTCVDSWSIAAIGLKNWATILSEAEETVNHQAWPMVCVECRRWRFIDFRSSHLQYLDDGRLYICCKDAEKYYNVVKNSASFEIIHKRNIYVTNRTMHQKFNILQTFSILIFFLSFCCFV